MKSHMWEIEVITAPGIGGGMFWICWSCGTSGGPANFLQPETEEPSNPWMFFAGTPLWELPHDCDEAKKMIDDYVKKYPEYQINLERSRNKPQAAPIDMR